MDEKVYWEYRAENIGNGWRNPKPEEIQEALNEWGLDGWEVITISHTPGGAVTVVAKRRLSEANRRRSSQRSNL